MNCRSQTKQHELLDRIVEFISHSTGLRCGSSSEASLSIHQLVDKKTISISTDSIEDVLSRSDSDGREFIQINFANGKKILLTDSLIGFKPQVTKGFESLRVPKVVTTPDLLSIFDAIQDSLYAGESADSEIASLRRLFESVLSGGESIGFNLSTERGWLSRLPTTIPRGNA